MSNATPLEKSFDPVIIGSGIAAGALATAGARRGLPVPLLEKMHGPPARVRGEFMPVWAQARAPLLA